MYEEASKVFEYLPIRRNVAEEEYIDHIWSTFQVIEKSDRLWAKNDVSGFAEADNTLQNARPFAIMPFHLLVILSIQYYVLRIAKLKPDCYEKARIKFGGRERHAVTNPQSVFTLGLLNEKLIFDFFWCVGLNRGRIESAKRLVANRNDNIAHVKGKKETDPERRVIEYMGILDAIQRCFLRLNYGVVLDWITEIRAGDDIVQFLEARFLDSCLSPRDFGNIVGHLLTSSRLDSDQWEQSLNLGLDLAYDQTIFSLRNVALTCLDNKKRNNAVRILEENGELDEGLCDEILK